MIPSLALSTKQQLAISPRLQQAIRLLQLSALEFEQELRDSLISNPFLEEVEEQGPATDDWGGVPSLGSAFERMRAPPPDGDDANDLSWAPERRGLRDYLRTQLFASRESPRIVLAGEAVIETVDDDGYLRDDPGSSAHALRVDPPLSDDEIQRAVALVRGFDPAGVCAHDLVDCLRLQLAALDGADEARDLALRVLAESLELLARHDYPAIARKLGCEEAHAREACALIRRLDPHPGSRYAPNAPDYVIPDVLVIRRRGRYAAVLNPAVRPNARLDQRYVEMFRGCRNGRHPAMSQQLQEARWFLRNAEQRFETIQRVADFIVEHQRDFFTYGDVALKPMVLREVADELGLHESTVSRATGNKHMETPRGCFEFKHFFSRELPMRGGSGCSAAAVRALIQEIIAEEGPDAPLSDVDIAAQLQAQGIGIARRTVSKYRRMLRLPPAELRRRA
ncbi:MAG: RNA polymerase factor sigma-54 [Gammaproteobacteria bacterium]